MFRIKSSKKGFTLVEIMIVVAIIGILVAIAVPGFIRARTESRAKACMENQAKIDGAVEQWALENNQATGAEATAAVLIGPEAYLQSEPVCPNSATGVYLPATVGTPVGCPTDDDDHAR